MLRVTWVLLGLTSDPAAQLFQPPPHNPEYLFVGLNASISIVPWTPRKEPPDVLGFLIKHTAYVYAPRQNTIDL